jgi:hypothetical protein
VLEALKLDKGRRLPGGFNWGGAGITHSLSNDNIIEGVYGWAVEVVSKAVNNGTLGARVSLTEALKAAREIARKTIEAEVGKSEEKDEPSRFHPAVEGVLCRHFEIGAVAGGSVFSESLNPHGSMLADIIPIGVEAGNIVSKAVKSLASNPEAVSSLTFVTGPQSETAKAIVKAGKRSKGGRRQLLVVVHTGSAESESDGTAAENGGRRAVYFPENSICMGDKLGWAAFCDNATKQRGSQKRKVEAKSERLRKEKVTWHTSKEDGGMRGPHEGDEWRQERRIEQLCPWKSTVYVFGERVEGREIDLAELAGVIASTTGLARTALRTKAPVFYTYTNHRGKAHNLKYERQPKSGGWDPDLAGWIADWNRAQIGDDVAKKAAKETGITENTICIFNAAKPKGMESDTVRVPTGIIPTGFSAGVQSADIRPSSSSGGNREPSTAGREAAVHVGCVHATSEAKLLKIHMELSQMKLASEGLLTAKRGNSAEEVVECSVCQNSVTFVQTTPDVKGVCFQCKPPSSNAATRTAELGQVRWYEGKGVKWACILAENSSIWKWGVAGEAGKSGWAPMGTGERSSESQGQWFRTLPALKVEDTPVGLRGVIGGGRRAWDAAKEAGTQRMSRSFSQRCHRPVHTEFSRPKRTNEGYAGERLVGKILKSREGIVYWCFSYRGPQSAAGEREGSMILHPAPSVRKGGGGYVLPGGHRSQCKKCIERRYREVKEWEEVEVASATTNQLESSKGGGKRKSGNRGSNQVRGKRRYMERQKNKNASGKSSGSGKAIGERSE